MNLPIAPIVAGLFGIGIAAGCALAPASVIESLVMDSGLPAVLSAAEPPLGFTARAGLALGAGGLVAVFTWFGLFLLLGSRTIGVGKAETAEVEAAPVPVLRRADAHPDAPARAPLLATRDLGTPFLEVTAPAKAEDKAKAVEPLFAPEPAAAARAPTTEPFLPPVEQDLPVDLEQPLAAFDPHAIPETPMPPPVAVSPLRPRPAVFDSSERFETFELTPMRRSAPPPRLRPAPRPEPSAEAPAPEPIANPKTDATIHALLERLEQGVTRRGIGTGPAPEANPREHERGLEDALVTLRNLARRA
jgi:hypothetical protein